LILNDVLHEQERGPNSEGQVSSLNGRPKDYKAIAGTLLFPRAGFYLMVGQKIKQFLN
jgi:hypothetical protein